MVGLQVYLQSRLTLSNLFAFLNVKKTFSTAQAQRESNASISIRYVISMLDNIFVFQANAFAAQV